MLESTAIDPPLAAIAPPEPVAQPAALRPRSALARTVLTAGVIALAVYLLVVAFALLSLRSDREALKHEVLAGFATGALDRQAGWRFADVRIGAHQFNDCLVLFQAIDNRATAAQLAVTPLSAPLSTKSMCGALQDLASDRPSSDLRFYHNYVHAQTSVARTLVPVLGVTGLRSVLKLVLALTLLTGCAFAAIGLAERRSIPENAIWLLLFALFGRWFGIEAFGQSLGHGPADLIPLLFLLFLCRGSAYRPLRERAAVIGCALFGALTMAFEMLTGGIPLGLALTIGCVPIALARDERIMAATCNCAVAFIVATVTVAGAKLAMIAAIFGIEPVTGALRQFLFRAGARYAENPDALAGPQEFFTRVWAGFESMALGMHWLAVGTFALALVLGGWGYSQLRNAPDSAARFRAAALVASAIVIPLWMVTLWQHTAQHAWFMNRILIWPMAAGFSLYLLALIERGRWSSFRAPAP